MWADLDNRIAKSGIRNATTTCIAPTGTISMIAGASGGIEPLFGLVFKRNIMDGTILLEVNPIFENYAKEHGFYSEALMEEIANTGSVAHIDGIDEKTKNIFVTAHDVSPEAHIMMQAAFQLHTDNAVSKTINFVESATVEDVAKAYMLGFKAGLKGLTVYRNNSRWSSQPMVIGEVKGTHKKEGEEEQTQQQEQGSQQNQPQGNVDIPSFESEHKKVETIGERTDENGVTLKTVVCPECGNSIEMAEGCFICLNCGYSGCS